MQLGRCLVQHVARADDSPARHPIAVLEDELATGEIHDALRAVAVRADLHAGRDPVELEADRHRAPTRRLT
jgi:hypothetical protein